MLNDLLLKDFANEGNGRKIRLEKRENLFCS